MARNSNDALLYDLGSLEPLPASQPHAWRRWVFGFLFVYLLLYNLPFPLDILPYQGDGEPLAPLHEWLQVYAQAKTDTITWFGTNVLRLEKVAEVQSGSGDTLFDYVQCATFASAAILLGVLFVLIDQRGRTMRFLHAMLRIHLRYVLAATLLSYGFHKVFPLQFGELDGERLYGTYGSASPMNMLWTFLSASPAYTVFSGGMEVLGGLLLLFRRTTTLGALVSIAVLGNVAMLNYCYDVPVKLYSSHLLFMAIVLLAKDAGRLTAVLFTNRPTAPVELRRPMPMWLLVPIQILKLALAGWIVWATVLPSYQSYRERGSNPPPFAGIWETTDFRLVAPEEVPAEGGAAEGVPAEGKAAAKAEGKAATPRDHWHHVVIQRYDPKQPTYVTVSLLGYSKQMFTMAVDAERHVWTLTPVGKDAGAPLELTYAERTVEATETTPARKEVELSGTIEGRTLHAVLQPRDPASFPIHNRGFHWIQEYPYNSNR
jgi:uncharacterized membrane protein YphA (DoxX/SURF4 family)